jgi:hypothetical protein
MSFRFGRGGMNRLGSVALILVDAFATRTVAD